MSIKIVLFLKLLLLSYGCLGQVLWLQQQSIKSLEKLDIPVDSWVTVTNRAGLEFYNTCKPGCGSSFYISGRDFIFKDFSSGQDPDKVLKNLVNYLASDLQKNFPHIEPSYWEKFLFKGFHYPVGINEKDAFTQLKLRQFKMDFATWKSKALKLRKSIQARIKSSDLTFDKALEASRRLGRDPEAMAVWAKKYGFDSVFANDIAEYGRLLSLADYLPPIKAIHPNLNEFLKSDFPARKLILLDVNGLGVTNRIAQDSWLLSGAQLDSLEEVSTPGNKKIQAIVESVRKQFKQMSGQVGLNYYVSGDSIGFEVPPLRKQDLKPIESWIKEQSAFYGVIQDISGSVHTDKIKAIDEAVLKINESKKLRPVLSLPIGPCLYDRLDSLLAN